MHSQQDKYFVAVRDASNPDAKFRFMQFANPEAAKAYVHDTTQNHPNYVVNYIE